MTSFISFHFHCCSPTPFLSISSLESFIWSHLFLSNSFSTLSTKTTFLNVNQTHSCLKSLQYFPWEEISPPCRNDPSEELGVSNKTLISRAPAHPPTSYVASAQLTRVQSKPGIYLPTHETLLPGLSADFSTALGKSANYSGHLFVHSLTVSSTGKYILCLP